MAAAPPPRKKKAAPDAAELREPLSAEELRRQAEERLAGLSAAAPAPEELAAAVHELRVHQIELEMQNEELRRAQLELEISRAKHVELFHLAPVGYLTLNEWGIVGDANLTAAHLLGVERRQLVGQPFSAFVVAADRKEYYRHLEVLKQTEKPQTCELRLQPVGGEPFWAHLDGQLQRAGGGSGEPRRYNLTFTDVHERVVAEEALRQREEQLARAVEGSGVGLWDWYPQTGEETFNERWAEIVGYTLAELAPTSIETWRGLCQPDDLRRADELLEEHFSGHSPLYECETRMRHKDGRWVWVLDRGKVSEWDRDGRPRRMIGTALDVTARKQAEHQLYGRAKELQALYGLAEIVERQGLTLDELYQELTDILPASWQYPRVACARTVIGDRELRTKDFTESAWMQSAPVTVKGSVVGRLEVGYREEMPNEDEGPFLKEERQLIDALAERLGRITESRQAEEALRQATDRLSLATRAGGVGVWDYDPVNDTLTWDEQMFRLYGITQEQFSGAYEAWQAGLHPEDRERGDAEIQAALRGEKEFDTEFRVLRPDGTVRDIHALALVQRDASGRATHLIGTNWDITEAKRLAEELRSSEANFRTLFETVDDIIVVATPDGRIVYANPALSAKLGYTATEVKALHVLDLNPGDRRAEAEAILAAMFKGERDSCSLELQSKSGAQFPAETRIWFGRWDGAECIFGVSKDITREQEALLYAQAQAELKERRQAEEALARSSAQLREQLLDTVKAMGAIISLRDPYTAAHERRVTELATAIALELGLGEEAREGLAFAGEVHDIGKVGVPAEILSKPAALSDLEFSLIKQHPQAGRELLRAIRFRQPVAEIVGQHHERLDGSGYPEGLKGEEILPEARILAVADVVEAMASHRPYRPSLGLEAALAEVHAGAGRRYDAAAVAACERVFAQGFAFSEP